MHGDKHWYYDPPNQIPSIGRRLKSGAFSELTSQLAKDELLIGLYWNQVPALVATHLDTQERMDAMESAWAPAVGYFAVDRELAKKGLT